MALTESGRIVFEDITEEGRIVVDSILVEDGQIVSICDLAGSISAISNVSGTINALKKVTGTVTSASALTGTLSCLKAITGALSSTTSVTGDILVYTAIAGDIIASSSVSGALKAHRSLSGSISVTSHVSGTLSAEWALAGTISVVTSASGALKRAVCLEAAVSPLIGGTTFDIAVANGTSEKVVNIGADFRCANLILTDLYLKIPQLATASKTAKLEVLTQRNNIIFSTGDLDASSVLRYSQHRLYRALQAPTKYKITTDANVSGVRIFNIGIRGISGYEIISATSSVSGSLTKYVPFSGAIAATTSISASLNRNLKLTGAISAISSLAAGLTVALFAVQRGFYYAKIGSTIFKNLNSDSFRITEELNKIPSFEFEIANTTENRAAIVAGLPDILRIYNRVGSIDTLMFTGIINADAIEYLSLERIRLVGYASYIDLNWRFHKHLNSEDAEDVGTVFDYSGSYSDYTTAANNDTINDVLPTFGGVNNALYIGQSEQFFGTQVKYSTKGVQAANAAVVFEYSKGSSVWASLDVLDETRAFTEDAGISYITIPHKPSDWAKDTVNSVKKFWIRARITAGSYTTAPKLDRIRITNVNVYMVYYLETHANSIMDEVLDGTGYSMDATDTCPSTKISIVAEYESKLRFIAGITNALTWDDNGDKKAYQWWIDTSKKVHLKQKRGNTLGDMSSKLIVLNNVHDYFNLSNRLHYFGNYDGLNQIRAVIEDTPSQDTHGIRELAVPEERYNNYIPLKEAAQKAMTYTKAPLQKIAATMPTRNWLNEAIEVGDTVTLHQDKWNVPEQAFQIVRADIGPRDVNFDLGVSQEHLDSLKAGLQRRMDISGIRMHGSTSLMQFGPETMNYQRINDTTVYPAHLKFEIPSDARYIHKVLLSWKLGSYRADVTGGTEHEGHDHGGAGGSGGAYGGGFAGAGGAFTPNILAGGAHTPTELGKAHTHGVTGSIYLSYNHYPGYLLKSNLTYDIDPCCHHHQVPPMTSAGAHTHSNPYTGSVGTHSHSFAVTSGSPSSTANAIVSLVTGSACASGACVNGWSNSTFATGSHSHYVGGTTGGAGGHSHSIGSTYSAGAHTHSACNTDDDGAHTHRVEIWPTQYDFVVYPIQGDLQLAVANLDSPAHAHTINYVSAHPHTGVTEGAHSDHTDPSIAAHSDHVITTEAGASVDLTLGIVEEAGGTVMQLTVNGEDVTTVDGDGTDIVITGYCTTGANTVEIAPILGSVAKGGATLEGRATVFLEAKKF